MAVTVSLALVVQFQYLGLLQFLVSRLLFWYWSIEDFLKNLNPSGFFVFLQERPFAISDEL